MQFQKKEKRQTTVRFDSHHVRLRTGEVQRKTGSYMYRWTDKLGKRNTIYAATLEDLREQEEQILVDQHDGIKANIKNVTVNDVYELWCQLKRGIKDSTMKNYIYMYELFVKPTFGKKKLVQVKKSDVRRFYNQLIDDKVLKPSTVDVIHNIVHQVFQIAVDDDRMYPIEMTLQGARCCISIGKGVIKALGKPSHVSIKISDSHDSLSVFPCDEDDVMAFRVPLKLFTDHRCVMRINSKQFVHGIMRTNQMDTSKTYVLSGEFLEEKNTAVFSLVEGVSLRTQKGMAQS